MIKRISGIENPFQFHNRFKEEKFISGVPILDILFKLE